MTEGEAEAFAAEWIAAWNSHDLDRIMGHYAEEVRFLSPNAERITGNGEVRGKAALRAYWAQALARLPDLHFELVRAFAGHRCLTILYRNERGKEVAETVEFDAQRRVVASWACYRALA